MRPIGFLVALGALGILSSAGCSTALPDDAAESSESEWNQWDPYGARGNMPCIADGDIVTARDAGRRLCAGAGFGGASDCGKPCVPKLGSCEGGKFDCATSRCVFVPGKKLPIGSACGAAGYCDWLGKCVEADCGKPCKGNVADECIEKLGVNSCTVNPGQPGLDPWGRPACVGLTWKPGAACGKNGVCEHRVNPNAVVCREK